MNLAERAAAEEQMDAADLPPEAYAAILTDLAKVNRLLLSHRSTLEFLERAVASHAAFSLLDVGFGHGDMLRAIWGWAMRQGKRTTLIGVDLNPRSAPVARAATPRAARIDYRTGDYADQRGQRLDLIVSSLVAHHMDEGELVAFLRFMEREARIGWFVNDLHRHGFAYRGFPLLARVMRWHRIVREDGTLSIARSFRRADWERLLALAGIEDARIVRRFPFRLCVERIR